MNIGRYRERCLKLICLLLLPFLSSTAQVNPLGETGVSMEIKLPIPDTLSIYRRIEQAKEVLNSDPGMAIGLLKQTWTDSRAIYYTNGIVQSLLSMGKAYTVMARYDEGLLVWQEGLKSIYLGGGDHRLLVSFYSNMGVVHSIKGAYPESLDILFMALKLAESVPSNDPAIATVYNNIASVFLKIPNTPPEKINHYLERGAFHARQANDDKLLSGILANMGTMYVQQRDWDKSKQLFDSALNIAVQKGLVETQYSLLLSIGELYLSGGKTEPGLRYLERAQKLDPKKVNSYYRTLADLRIGEAYAQLKDYNKALRFIQKADTASREAGNLSSLPQIYDSYSRLYKKMGNHEKALEYYQLYAGMNDSILKQNSLNYISEMEIKYQSAQKEKEIVKNKLTISSQQNRISRNNIFIGLALAFVVLLGVISIITVKNSRQRHKIILKEKSIDNLKSMIDGEEKERIRISKELHDGIGGMLAAIKYNFNALAKGIHREEQVKVDNVKSMLEMVSDEVRAMAYNLVPDVVIRFGLKEALQMYCSGLTSADLDINLQFYGSTERMGKPAELILYRVIQELLQNTIKHAGGTMIDIQVMEYDQHINLTFEDNGKGFMPDKVSAGLGLQNIRSRIASLQGTLSIVSPENRGTSVHIAFPIGEA
jgi:signal transduction histidine kinase